MIVEHARITVHVGSGPAFEQAIGTAATTVLPRAEGFQGIKLYRCIEQPETYVCALQWDTVEAHTVTFREGPLFAEWRALIGPHFIETPSVQHFAPVTV
jgi:heme-degrading monooxygenase HmoA